MKYFPWNTRPCCSSINSAYVTDYASKSAGNVKICFGFPTPGKNGIWIKTEFTLIGSRRNRRDQTNSRNIRRVFSRGSSISSRTLADHVIRPWRVCGNTRVLWVSYTWVWDSKNNILNLNFFYWAHQDCFTEHSKILQRRFFFFFCEYFFGR